MQPQSKIQAEVAAVLLAKRMKGHGWKTRVWENVGWHYEVRCGAASVSPNHDGTYGALIGEAGGLGCWTGRACRFKDPNRAVRYALKNARARLDECVKMVKGIEKMLGKEGK